MARENASERSQTISKVQRITQFCTFFRAALLLFCYRAANPYDARKRLLIPFLSIRIFSDMFSFNGINSTIGSAIINGGLIANWISPQPYKIQSCYFFHSIEAGIFYRTIKDSNRFSLKFSTLYNEKQRYPKSRFFKIPEKGTAEEVL